MTRKMTICLAAAVILAAAMPAAAATDKTCLTGNDPAVSNDAGQIAALEAAIDEACPCGSFDGSAGRTHGKYLRCAATEINAAVKDGNLRRQCKGRVVASFRGSICGYAAERDAVPCIERSAAGKLHCSIRPAADCVDRPGRYTRTACSSRQSCVDAADSNHDHRVDADDAGVCVPTPTPTSAPTDTTTPTATPTDTTTPTATPTGTPTPVTTISCASEGPIPWVVVNPGEALQESVILPVYPEGLCPEQSPSGGGCALFFELDRTLTHVFDASASFDRRVPSHSGPPVTYLWEFLMPPQLGSSVYSSINISGQETAQLTLHPSALLPLEGLVFGTDTFWRARLTVAYGEGECATVVYFRFKYILP